jgi:flavin reductase (DIM6/NTAB) family NADH-FMN oxidoreductase RutF
MRPLSAVPRLVKSVDRRALTTATNPVPGTKLRRGYRFERDKFELAGLTPMASETIAAPRVLECAVQLGAKVAAAINGLAENDDTVRRRIDILEARIQRVFLNESILMDGEPDQADPSADHELSAFLWVGVELHDATLAQIPEAQYRGPDILRARVVPPIGAANIGRVGVLS